MTNITKLLEKYQGQLVQLVEGETPKRGLLLRDKHEGQSDDLHGWGVIIRGSIPGWYGRFYFGPLNCEVREKGGVVVMTLDRDKGYDIGVFPKPAYDCFIKTCIEALETALRSEVGV